MPCDYWIWFMENSFLKAVAQEAISQHSADFENLIFVVPGKRAALFLKKYVAQCITSASIAPEFLTIQELMVRISAIQRLDALPLLFEFYQTYLDTCKTEPNNFETFVSWGQTLLSDFNEIDQYLVNPNKIFPYINAIKEAEHWSGADDLTDAQKEHLKFWNTLGDYYFALQEKLTQQKRGYSGFIAKKAVENLPDFLQKNPNKKYVFAGFNALSTAEQRVIQAILADDISQIYWDIDHYFIEDEQHDAGLFIRKYIKKWKYYENRKPKWLGNDYLQPKTISITGLPNGVNQAHAIGEMLQGVKAEQLENTALILADENLLMPVLQSVKLEIPMNITMGYPLQYTPVNDLFTAYFRLYLSKNFYYKDIINFINQPFLQHIFPAQPKAAFLKYINENNISYLTREKMLTFLSEEKVSFILIQRNETELVNKLINNCLNIIYLIKSEVEFEKHKHILLLEYLYRFYQLFNQLKLLQEQYGYIDSVKTLYHFYLDVLQKSKLDFVGEPLEGLQLMGVLESRNLDFENVIIASVNEGVLPSGRRGNSFIPYDVKIALGLPTYKERDAIFSYHFYRLLQRAKTIDLFYDMNSNALNGKEKSRFVLQLLAQRIDKHQVIHQIKAPEVYPVVNTLIKVQKDEQVMQRLKAMAENGLSPSALTNYVLNPLIFYKQNVLQVYEERDVEETVEARTFGDIVHATLEALYKPILHKVLTKKDILTMKTLVSNTVDKYFQEKLKSSEYKQGKNLLIYNVILEYLHRFLDKEIAEIENGTSIKVLDLEVQLKVPFDSEHLPFPVNIKGIVDRVELRNGILHIIDYKTGAVSAQNLGVTNWDLLITDFKYSKAFQLLTYAFMYYQSTEVKNIWAGNFSFKRLNEGLVRFHTKISRGEKDYNISEAVIQEYKTITEKLLLEIFNPKIPFQEV